MAPPPDRGQRPEIRCLMFEVGQLERIANCELRIADCGFPPPTRYKTQRRKERNEGAMQKADLSPQIPDEFRWRKRNTICVDP